jgi:acetyl-CoA synthetase
VKGDRVIIYMPLTIEGAVAMLACARIGAIHSVVYAGLGHTALRDRITDAQAKIVIAGDVGYRRGKTIALKAIVDEALESLDCVEKVIVYSRGKTEINAPREIDFNDLLKFPPDCPAEEMDAEDPLFLLYTSGSTGKPKGVLHVHGGYMVGTTYHLESFFDVGERDIFWCTSDIGWVVGHSYIVYAPLCAGVTTLFREGAIDFPSPGTRLGNRRTLRRHQNVHRAHRAANVHALRRDLSSRARSHHSARHRLRWRAAESRSLALGPDSPRRRRQVGLRHRQLVANRTWLPHARHAAFHGHASRQSRSRRPRRRSRCLDEDGNPVPPNVGGRLVLKRPFPCMLRTVWRDPARYERDWQFFPGYYVTGDVAMKDEDGYIAVLGRSDDVLNVAGHRIGTAEVESALVSHPAVAEAAAIGVPDPLKGEKPSKPSSKSAPITSHQTHWPLRPDRARETRTGPDRNTQLSGVRRVAPQDAFRQNPPPLPQSQRSRSRRRRRLHHGGVNSGNSPGQ